MKFKLDNQSRWILGVTIVLADFLLFFAPLGAMLLAYIIIARPKWVQDFVKNLYESEN